MTHLERYFDDGKDSKKQLTNKKRENIIKNNNKQQYEMRHEKMNDKIRICIVGAGRAGMIHVKNYVTQIRNAEVTAVVDPVPRLAELMCKEFEIGKSYLDYKSALEDKNIDAIVITSPTVFHKDLVVDFANAGKHIFCEKPMAMNENECDEMVDVCKKKRFASSNWIHETI